MSKKKKHVNRRKLFRKAGETVAKLLDRKPKAEGEPEAKPEPKSGSLSHEKQASRKAVFSQPHRAPGAKFLDPRRKSYEVTKTRRGEHGQLRRAKLQPPEGENKRKPTKGPQ